MSWKRLLVSVPLGFLIMIADGVSLMVVNRLYRPGYPPGWVTGLFFYFDAWPVLFLTFSALVWLLDGAASGRLGGVLAAALT